jgi:hypothetical protein
MFDLQMALLKGLAVAGAAAVGFLAGGSLLKLIGRLLLVRRIPRSGMFVTRLLSGIAVGMLVYLWVFGEGGLGGMGGEGGWWPFGAKGGPGQGNVIPTPSPAEPAKTPLPQERQPMETPHALTIRLLGGRRVDDQRFYLVQGEKAAMDWPELTKWLLERKKADPALQSLEIELFADSVDRDNPAVTQLERWCKEKGLAAKLVFPPGNLPDGNTKPAAK